MEGRYLLLNLATVPVNMLITIMVNIYPRILTLPPFPNHRHRAMIILGFAGVGFVAYRRKSKPALMAA